MKQARIVNNQGVKRLAKESAPQRGFIRHGDKAFPALNSVAFKQMNDYEGFSVLVQLIRRRDAWLFGRRDDSDKIQPNFNRITEIYGAERTQREICQEKSAEFRRMKQA